jgi:hypothetical protein
MLLVIGAIVALVVAMTGTASAAENVVVRRDQAPSTASAARESAALAFAAEHHPELVPLLERLREGAADEFHAAIVDLERTRERIDRLRERQPERYEWELAEWKLSSRIRLALARLSTSPSADAEAALRQLVRDRQARRLAALEAERNRITARLEKITAEIAAHDADPEAAIEKEFASLRAKAQGPDRRPRAKPGKPAELPPQPGRGQLEPALQPAGTARP